MAILQDLSAAEKAELLALRAENAKLKAKNEARAMSRISLKVSEKGALSLYGLGRFPVTLYKGQWVKLLAIVDEIKQALVDHDSELKDKD